MVTFSKLISYTRCYSRFISILKKGFFYTVTVTYGTCFPHDKCYRLCEQISPLADEMDVNVTLKNCTSFCCKEDLCNDDISAQIQTSTMSTAVSTAMVDITTAAVPSQYAIHECDQHNVVDSRLI